MLTMKVITQERVWERIVAPHIQEHFVEVFMKSPQERGFGSHHGADRGNTTDLQEHVAAVFTMIGQERVSERVVELTGCS